MNNPICIYGICDPRTSELRYVGKTVNLFSRVIAHRNCAKNCATNGRSYHCYTWMKSVYDSGSEPEFFVIEQCSGTSWIEAERFWIQYFLAVGANLTNHRSGGEGGEHSKETKELIGRLAKARVQKYTPEQRAAKCKGAQRVTIHSRPCASCGNMFTPSRWHHKTAVFCSRHCSLAKAYKMLPPRRKTEVPSRECPVCHKDFTPCRPCHINQVFCSTVCVNAHKAEQFRIKMMPRPCAFCSTMFSPSHRTNTEQKFCSPSCSTKNRNKNYDYKKKRD